MVKPLCLSHSFFCVIPSRAVQQQLAQAFTLYFFVACYWNNAERGTTDRYSLDDPNFANVLVILALSFFWVVHRKLSDVSFILPSLNILFSTLWRTVCLLVAALDLDQAEDLAVHTRGQPRDMHHSIMGYRSGV